MVRFASFDSSRLVVRDQLALVDEYRVDRPAPGAGNGGTSRASGEPAMGRVPSDTPAVTPADDVKALEALEKKITTLAARIHAATHRLLVLIAEFDRRQGWRLGGHRSCAHWLSYRTGIDLGTAREKVRTARVLAGLPETSASMSRGELSFSQVRAVTRVATPANERTLLRVARTSTTAQLEQKVRAFKRGSREDEAALERRRFESRTLSVFSDHEGMYVIRGRLTAEVGALLMRAVEAAGDALYREEDRGPERKGAMGPNSASNPSSEVEPQKAAAQRRADALGLLAERALAAGFGGDGESRGHGDEIDDGIEARAEVEAGAEAGAGAHGEHGPTESGLTRGGPATARTGRTPAPISGTRAERYQVMLHVEAETLRSDGEGGRSELEDGTRVSAETSQRLSCDAGLVRVHHARDGSILDVGRRTRTIPPALRRALEVRDGGCRFPGCGSRFTEGHHVTHWAEGGETSLANCLLICKHHHRLVHEGGWRVEWRDQVDRTDDSGRDNEGARGGGGGARRHPVFIDPRGGVHSDGGVAPPGG